MPRVRTLIFLQEFEEAKKYSVGKRGTRGGEKREKISKWKLPVRGRIKINFDAAVKNNIAAIACVARDYSGAVVGLKMVMLLETNSLVVEARAASLAVELVIEKKWKKVEFEGDSSIVIDSIEAQTGAPPNGLLLSPSRRDSSWADSIGGSVLVKNRNRC